MSDWTFHPASRTFSLARSYSLLELSEYVIYSDSKNEKKGKKGRKGYLLIVPKKVLSCSA